MITGDHGVKDLPNVVLLVVDDLGWRDLSCFGSGFYETPHIDRLAAEGIRFTSAYATAPVCSPTRASLLTGRYPARIGLTQYIPGHSVGRLCDVPSFHVLPRSEVSLAIALRAHGYQCWHVGKWHLGDHASSPEVHGFDVNMGGGAWGMLPRGYYSPYGLPTLEDGPVAEYLTDRLTDEAIALIRGRTGPFFLNLWHYAVHIPIEAPAGLVEKYRAKAKRRRLGDEASVVEGEPFPCDHLKDDRIRRRLRQSDPTYAAMLENLDHNTGRLLNALRDEGILDQTIVILTSDNGGLSTAEGAPTTNYPLAEGKGWPYEGGVRVPQIVRWPAVAAAGAVSDVPVMSADWYPTLLEAAALPPRPEQHCDGVSLMPALRGDDSLGREAIFWHYPHYSNQGGRPASWVRAGNWKLIEHFEDSTTELYDLAADPEEKHDLSSIEPDRARQLGELLRQWRKSVSTQIPASNPNYSAGEGERDKALRGDRS